ncbi:ArdC family protein [Mucilaginibacter calamicampi]|uniref:ArdC family protein n=1 Tax=Mucilaginibacter calamicampi TaxID=1302352 RepID=A0ABW2Z1N9_9SPHI
MENTTTQTKHEFKVPRLDVHDLVTNIIIEQLENGVIPWEKPFLSHDNSLKRLPVNYTTGKQYRGINILLLWCAAMKRGHETQEWASMKQWNAKGESIRKGEKGNLVVYYDTFEKEKDGEVQKISFLKASYVFNRSQLKGYTPPESVVDQMSKVERFEAIDKFIANTKAVIEYHSGGAYYMPLEDKIMMPKPEQFLDTDHCSATENFHSVMFHELTHWTGGEKRLQRINHKKFGDKNYAIEELVAELGAAFLCNSFGISSAEKGNHAAYIDNWLKVLKENNRCIVTAASEASKAVEFLHTMQTVPL